MTRKNETGYKKHMNEKEFKLIIDNLKLNKDDHYVTIFYIMRYTGLRPSDSVKLKYSEIKGDFEYLELFMKKTKNWIKIPVHPLLKQVLKWYCSKYKNFGFEYLFKVINSNAKGEHITTASLNWKMWKLRKKLKIDDFYFTQKTGKKFHRLTAGCLRHLFAQNIYENSGFDSIVVSKALGHKDMSVAPQYYLYAGDNKVKNCINLI